MTDTLPLATPAKTLAQIATTEHADALLAASDHLMRHAHFEQDAGIDARRNDLERSARHAEASHRAVSHAIALHDIFRILVAAGAQPSSGAGIETQTASDASALCDGRDRPRFRYLR